MRGRPNPQRSMLAIANLEERVPQDHPRRRIKEVAGAALGAWRKWRYMAWNSTLRSAWRDMAGSP